METDEDFPAPTVPSIVISQYDPVPEPLERAELEKEPQSVDKNCSQDKPEDSDNPLTSHFKMIFKGLTRSRSQESLVSMKSTSDDDPPNSDATPCSSQNESVRAENSDGPSWRHFNTWSNKKEKITTKLSVGANKAKGKENGTLPKADDSQGRKSHVNWEQLEATKAIFDLLKEISGWFTASRALG